MSREVYTMKKKEFKEISNYSIYSVNLAPIMEKRNISKNHLCRMTGLSYTALQRYYKSELKRIDLDVISRICAVLDCNIEDILSK